MSEKPVSVIFALLKKVLSSLLFRRNWMTKFQTFVLIELVMREVCRYVIPII